MIKPTKSWSHTFAETIVPGLASIASLGLAATSTGLECEYQNYYDVLRGGISIIITTYKISRHASSFKIITQNYQTRRFSSRSTPSEVCTSIKFDTTSPNTTAISCNPPSHLCKLSSRPPHHSTTYDRTPPPPSPDSSSPPETKNDFQFSRSLNDSPYLDWIWCGLS